MCDLLQPIPARTRLTLVTHVFEYYKPSNTGHLAVACLPQAQQILRGGKADPPMPPLWEPPSIPLLLFPTPDAILLTDWIAARGPEVPPVTLIVPDGTWGQCKRARKRIPTLDQVQPITLPFAGPSEYRLRHAANPHQLSTLEAIAAAYALLDGPAVAERLRFLFRVAVERALFSNGRISREQLTTPLPTGASQHGPRTAKPAEPAGMGGEVDRFLATRAPAR
jgi:DTW domain-containing protein YfiP